MITQLAFACLIEQEHLTLAENRFSYNCNQTFSPSNRTKTGSHTPHLLGKTAKRAALSADLKKTRSQ
ncbi:hypothetical protein ACIPL1_23330 [Pseudomonas sp. NPDC090202]|uniref:hypothetical protein n=1 Tax=unclassified Pseudomonas TaxID=196821 RepID=UPI00381502D9